jgi:F-type H+-transporting ATPase subunit beta
VASDARGAALECLDGTVAFTRGLALLGLYPAVDPFVSTSRAVDAALVGPEHAEIAARVRQELYRFRELMAAGTSDLERLRDADRRGAARARKLQRFLTQPFFVAEPWTKWAGKWVGRADTVRGCRAILEGDGDDLPEEAFAYIGGVEEAAVRAGELGG